MPDRQTVIPMLAYEDGVAAMEWLVRVFGFVEKERWLDDDGRLAHGEVQIGDSVVMFASPSPHYHSPKTLREKYPPADQWLSVPFIFNGVMAYVDDLDAHFQRAKAAGAVLTEIDEGFPGRRYRAEDLEGNRWFFFEK